MSLQAECFVFSETGCAIAGDPSFEQWADAVTNLERMRKCIHWWLGDLLLYGEQRWGEMYAQAAQETGYDFGTLANDKYVSQRVAPETRLLAPSHAHAQTVAPLEPPEQVTWLQQAKADSLTVPELRRRLVQAGHLQTTKRSRVLYEADGCFEGRTWHEHEETVFGELPSGQLAHIIVKAI